MIKESLSTSTLHKVIITYALKDRPNFNALLKSISHRDLVALIEELLDLYYNDKNSSTLRQFVLVSLSGFIPSDKKIGYNGYRESPIKKEEQYNYCEAKPKNINVQGKKQRKLDGGGNFTDYTWNRLKKDIKQNPIMIVGGFIDGKLIYIFRFPFNTPSFVAKLAKHLEKHFPKGDIEGRFLRSASFTLKDYVNTKGLEVEVFANKTTLNQNKNYLTSAVFTLLAANIDEEQTTIY